jgi:hypothetical protein
MFSGMGNRDPALALDRKAASEHRSAFDYGYLGVVKNGAGSMREWAV